MLVSLIENSVKVLQVGWKNSRRKLLTIVALLLLCDSRHFKHFWKTFCANVTLTAMLVKI